MGMLGPLLNRKSDLSVRNGVLLYKQLIRPLSPDAKAKGGMGQQASRGDRLQWPNRLNE